MCAWLEVSRSGYYAWRGAEPSQRSKDDSALIAVMKKVYDGARGNPGVRRMRAGLAALGHLVSHKRVHRLMQAAGLRGRHPKAWKRTTIGGDQSIPAPDLIGRDFTAALPDTRWCGDVTYIKTWDGWAYLATVIDLYSRKVVGWATAAHMRTSLIIAALDMAIATRKPPAGVIFHSDRGCQYQCRLVKDGRRWYSHFHRATRPGSVDYQFNCRMSFLLIFDVLSYGSWMMRFQEAAGLPTV